MASRRLPEPTPDLVDAWQAVPNKKLPPKRSNVQQIQPGGTASADPRIPNRSAPSFTRRPTDVSSAQLQPRHPAAEEFQENRLRAASVEQHAADVIERINRDITRGMANIADLSSNFETEAAERAEQARRRQRPRIKFPEQIAFASQANVNEMKCSDQRTRSTNLERIVEKTEGNIPTEPAAMRRLRGQIINIDARRSEGPSDVARDVNRLARGEPR